MTKRVASFDPGSTTGYVIVDFPTGPGLDIARARMCESGVIKATRRDDESVAERDTRFIDRLAEPLIAYRPSLVIVEEPSDAADYWGAEQGGAKDATVQQLATGKIPGARKGHHMKRGTLFRLGVHYALVLAAARECKIEVISYQVQGTKERGRGWMGYGTKRSNVLREMGYLFATLFGRTARELAPTEHELMALGVLNYHASQLNLVAPRGTRAAS